MYKITQEIILCTKDYPLDIVNVLINAVESLDYSYLFGYNVSVRHEIPECVGRGGDDILVHLIRCNHSQHIRPLIRNVGNGKGEFVIKTLAYSDNPWGFKFGIETYFVLFHVKKMVCSRCKLSP